MRTAGMLLFVAAAGLGSFSLWGLSAPEGRTRFDEMDGMIPLGAGVLAFVFGLLAVGILIAEMLRSPRDDSQ